MARDGMSFDKYIDNPSGAATVLTNRQMYKAMYKEKFEKVLIREQGVIKFVVYRSNDAYDSYYIYMKIPSEVIDKFYYDVVVRLFTNDNVKKTNGSLRPYAVQFYANDPAYVYTFAHSFAKNKLFIEDLKPKMSRKALTTVAKVKNPKDDVWYVKSLYFAYLTMEKYGLFNRPMLNQNAKLYDKRDLISRITDADAKVQARQDAQEKINKENKQNKEREKKDRIAAERTNPHAVKTSKVSKISNVVSHTKFTRNTKTTNKK